jgi:Protein of unknown function (DUF3703)
MQFYWTMPAGLKVYYQQELSNYKAAFKENNLAVAWHHLERAHVLGQSWPREHNYVHWLMLKFGVHIKSGKEIIGQIPRLLIGGVKSFVGTIPVGNTGGANVPPMLPMKIPDDMAALLNRFKKS